MVTTTFRILYFGVIGLIVLVLTLASIMGSRDSENSLGTAILLSYLSLIFVGLPLFVIFLGLNLWGFLKHNTHRLQYGLVLIPLSVWIAWSIYEYLTLPLP